MKPLSFLPLACVILVSSCHSLSGNSLLFHSETSLYSIDTVRMAMDGGDEKAAQRKLEEAAELFKKGSDTVKSIALFKSSILLKPTAKAYFDLAGALLSTRRYAEALNALSIAEKLGYTPRANLMFRYAYAYANTDNGQAAGANSSQAIHYAELAIQMGYAHPRQFLQKELFPILADNHDFEEVYPRVISGGAGRDPEKGLWDAYASQFSELPLPLVIDFKWMKRRVLNDLISFQYEKFIPEMREAKFSRGGGDDYYYVGLVRKTADFVALLYCANSGEDVSARATFNLVTYDPQGRIIDKMVVAGRKDYNDNFRIFSIRPNLQFRIQEFKDVYKDAPEAAGYDSSNISRQDALQPEDYRISDKGKFERTGAPLALR